MNEEQIKDESLNEGQIDDEEQPIYVSLKGVVDGETVYEGIVNVNTPEPPKEVDDLFERLESIPEENLAAATLIVLTKDGSGLPELEEKEEEEKLHDG